MEILIGRQGSQKTPISDPSVSRQHCKVTPNGDGTYTIENLSASGTKVDGVDIIRITADANCMLQLGPSFKARLIDLIDQQVAGAVGPASKPGSTSNGKKDVPAFSISHLRDVWDDYDNENISIAEKNRNANLVRTVSPIFTVGAGIVGSFWSYGFIFMVVGVLAMLYGFFGMKNAESPKQKRDRKEAFMEKWVCPNPNCRKYLPEMSYKKLLRNHQTCPYCKCKFVE